MRSSKKLKLGMWSIYEQSNSKINFCIFWSKHLGCIKVLTIGIAMRNLVNYDSAGPVLIGIAMRKPVKYEYWLGCSPVSIGIPMQNLVKYEDGHATCSCAVRHSYAEFSELQIGLGLAYIINWADSSLFAGNRIRLPISTVTLKHSKSIKTWWNLPFKLHRL